MFERFFLTCATKFELCISYHSSVSYGLNQQNNYFWMKKSINYNFKSVHTENQRTIFSINCVPAYCTCIVYDAIRGSPFMISYPINLISWQILYVLYLLQNKTEPVQTFSIHTTLYVCWHSLFPAYPTILFRWQISMLK